MTYLLNNFTNYKLKTCQYRLHAFLIKEELIFMTQDHQDNPLKGFLKEPRNEQERILLKEYKRTFQGKELTKKGIELIYINILALLYKKTRTIEEISEKTSLNQYKHQTSIAETFLKNLKDKNYVNEEKKESLWKITDKGFEFLSKHTQKNDPYNSYQSYVNYFLKLGGQEPILSNPSRVTNKKPQIHSSTESKYRKEVKDFSLFYEHCKDPNNRKKKEDFEKAKEERKGF